MRLVERAPNEGACNGRCEACGRPEAGAAAGDVQGTRLAFWSAAVFLWPLAGMAAGAALAGTGGARQVAGALAGGAACALIARGVLRLRPPAASRGSA